MEKCNRLAQALTHSLKDYSKKLGLTLSEWPPAGSKASAEITFFLQKCTQNARIEHPSLIVLTIESQASKKVRIGVQIGGHFGGFSVPGGIRFFHRFLERLLRPRERRRGGPGSLKVPKRDAKRRPEATTGTPEGISEIVVLV